MEWSGEAGDTLGPLLLKVNGFTNENIMFLDTYYKYLFIKRLKHDEVWT